MNTAKDMKKVYEGTSTENLIKNLHRKQVALYHVRMERGYWAKKECARLEYLMNQIEDEIGRRVGGTYPFKG